jgi:hypothetical protein
MGGVQTVPYQPMTRLCRICESGLPVKAQLCTAD